MEQGGWGGGRGPGTHGTAVSEDLQDPFIEGEPGWASLSWTAWVGSHFCHSLSGHSTALLGLDFLICKAGPASALWGCCEGITPVVSVCQAFVSSSLCGCSLVPINYCAHVY